MLSELPYGDSISFHKEGIIMSTIEKIISRKSASKSSGDVAALKKTLLIVGESSVIGKAISAEIAKLTGSAVSSADDESLLKEFISETGSSGVLDLLRSALKQKEKSSGYHGSLRAYATLHGVVGNEEMIKTHIRENPRFIQSGLSLEEFAKQETA
jgi:hypothetical protein